MILILVPLLGVLVGLLLYGGFRLTGAFGTLGDVGRRPEGWRERTHGLSLRERAEEIPRGCLLGVVAAAGVWILGWLIFLGIGLHLLG